MRKNYNAARRNRQHSRRELRMAAKSESFVPFGVRRRMAYESAAPIIEAFNVLRDDGVIDERLKPRQVLHVTEMPLTSIQKQVSRGIVAGYELGKRSVKEKKRITSAFSHPIEVTLGEADLFRGRHLGYRVHSEELEEEYHDIRLSLGNIGIKGTMRDVVPLHVTCGTADGHVRKSDLRSAVRAMNELRSEDPLQLGSSEEGMLHVPLRVVLEPVEFYPGEY